MAQTKEEQMLVAQTILEQLGNARFKMFTGAKNLTALESGLSFTLPNNFAKDGINYVRIELTPMDTYKVMFQRITRAPKFEAVVVAEHDDVYSDNLADIFTSVTGLHTHF